LKATKIQSFSYTFCESRTTTALCSNWYLDPKSSSLWNLYGISCTLRSLDYHILTTGSASVVQNHCL